MNRLQATLALALAAASTASSAAQQETSDPNDGRHVELVARVSRERIVVERVSVRPGQAHAQLARSSAFRVHLFDSRDGLLQESGFPDPLELRVYRSRPAPSKEGGGAAPEEGSPHSVEKRPEASATILLPLLPGLSSARLGWSKGAFASIDLRKSLIGACLKDEHAACRRYLDSIEK